MFRRSWNLVERAGVVKEEVLGMKAPAVASGFPNTVAEGWRG